MNEKQGKICLLWEFGIISMLCMREDGGNIRLSVRALGFGKIPQPELHYRLYLAPYKKLKHFQLSLFAIPLSTNAGIARVNQLLSSK